MVHVRRLPEATQFLRAIAPKPETTQTETKQSFSFPGDKLQLLKSEVVRSAGIMNKNSPFCTPSLSNLDALN